MTGNLDHLVSPQIRREIEERYYARINEKARFENLAHDKDFMANPHIHVGLFADHGVSHARDVANQIQIILDHAHGVIIPRRPAKRFAFMQGYGSLLAYLHDIGMVDFTPFGRSMHPEFAAQTVFSPEFDDLFDWIWHDESHGVANYITHLVDLGFFKRDPKVILREILSLSLGHSKSKLPIAVLNDHRKFRAVMDAAVGINLQDLYQIQKQQKNAAALEPAAQDLSSWDFAAILNYIHPGINDKSALRHNPHPIRFYENYWGEAYDWITTDDPRVQEFIADIVDTIRCLRCADALRVRGTILVTSGKYQIFVDHRKGTAVYAFRYGEKHQFLLELVDLISAGEANIASSELDPAGDLRITFHRGSFSEPGAQDRAARSAAIIINDIQEDAIHSFIKPTTPDGIKSAEDMAILLEETEDDLTFTPKVRDHLGQLDSHLCSHVRLVPSLKSASDLERERYLAATAVEWDTATRHALFYNMRKCGHPVDENNADLAFENTRVTVIFPGEELIKSGTPSTFVYVPLNEGLLINPIGEYGSFPVQPWMFLGMTGVIRNAERNATVLAQKEVEVLIIPRMTYLKFWHQTLTLADLQEAVLVANQRFDAATD